MYCEDCGSAMYWRCTNNITQIAKFKCPNCGHVQTGKLTVKEPATVEHRKPKYYHLKDGRYIVKKKKDKKSLYVGAYGNEETAKKVVDEMIKCGWDLEKVPVIYDKLNIHKVKRVWVCAA